MKRSGRLDRNKLLHVQALLWNLGKKNLYKIFMEFARQCNGAPPHFFSNGIDDGDTERSPVRFHISGDATDRRQIQKLQGLVAKLLVISEETIFLNEVQPVHSIVVTFLIPNDAVAILKDLTSEEKGLLQHCDVDCVFFGEFKISIRDEKFETPEKMNERDEVNKLLNKNKKLQKDLEDTQLQLVSREKDLARLQRAVSGSETLDKSQYIFKRSTSDEKFETPEKMNERDEINKLLNRNKQLQKDLENTKLQLVSREKDLARLQRAVSGSETPDKSQYIHKRSTSASSHDDVLNKISVHLTDEHREKLSERYTFTPEELEHLQQNKHHLLRVLIDKDIKVDMTKRALDLLRTLDDDSILQKARNFI